MGLTTSVVASTCVTGLCIGTFKRKNIPAASAMLWWSWSARKATEAQAGTA
jgi:hypothetical protein